LRATAGANSPTGRRNDESAGAAAEGAPVRGTRPSQTDDDGDACAWTQLQADPSASGLDSSCRCCRCSSASTERATAATAPASLRR
ncbi:hypothetical protein B8W95_13360, partial [Staphylococcus pasteuri]